MVRPNPALNSTLGAIKLGVTIMSQVHIIGIDIGKNTFHLVGHDFSGRETFRHKFTRQKYLLIHFVLKVNWIRFGNVGEVQPNRFNQRICRYLSSYQLSTFAMDSLTFDLTPRSTICLGGLTVKAYWKARTIHGQPVNSIV